MNMNRKESTWETLEKSARDAFHNGDYSEAEKLAIEALEIAQHEKREDSKAAILHTLGTIYMRLGQYDKAENALIESLKIKESILSPNHHAIATSYNQLAQLLNRKSQYAEAEKLYRRALDIFTVLNDKRNQAITLHNLGATISRQNNFSEAEALFRRTLQIQEENGESRAVSQTLNSLGILYLYRKRWQDAEIIFRRAVKLAKSQLGDNHPETAFILRNLAKALDRLEKTDEADKIRVEAYEVLLRTFGPEHPYVKELEQVKGKA